MNDKLSLYVELLLKWQEKINLISTNSKTEIWQRHIEDSLQLQKFVPPQTKAIIDLGSGAGLPGIVLAVATGIKTYLIESDRRKSIFLQEVVRQLWLDAHIINERIEKAKLDIGQGEVIITARGLADLDKIFAIINSLLVNNNLENRNGTMYKILLLKGKNVSRETLEAEKRWEFNAIYQKSETDTESSIVIIDKFKRKVL